MTYFQKFMLKNAMLVVIIIITAVASAFMVTVNQYIFVPSSPFGDILSYRLDDFLGDCIMMVLVVYFILLYERPIRQYVDRVAEGTAADDGQAETARRRLLNEPFFVFKMTIILWVVGAVFYSIVFRSMGIDWLVIRLNLADALVLVLVTLFLTLSIMIYISQRYLAPVFFPNGGLLKVRATRRIGLKTRAFLLLVVLNLLPLGSIARVQYRIYNTDLSPEMQFTLVSHAIWFIVPSAMVTGLVLTLMAVGSGTHAVLELVEALGDIARGDLKRRVKVTTNDEIGYAGEVINNMVAGLEERDRMRQSLEVAREVQQNLIPHRDPVVQGLDIAGRTIYCERTGGDYYDYLEIDEAGSGRIGIVVGDVSDHGIQSALLMAAARAFIRQRAQMPGGPAAVLNDVNRQICRDVEDSGQFITLFYCEFHAEDMNICWAGAGHDPAIVYDRSADTFSELKGHGPALGLLPDLKYEDSCREIAGGQIILIGTDGIWETQNQAEEMFGKDSLRAVMRANRDLPAQGILEAVVEQLDFFSYPVERKDDVTMVVVKVGRRIG